MNRIAPLVGLLISGVLMGATLALQTSQIFIPFVIQRQVVYNPSAYLSSISLYAGQTGNVTLQNIMQAVVYVGSASLSASAVVVNTAQGFSILTFTLHFGPTSITLNGLANSTKTIVLQQGIYPVSLTIDYATLQTITNIIQGSAKLILTTS